MKLTKTKLKQIIKEEIDKILDEGFLDSLTNMFGKTSGSGSAILDKAIKASKFDDFEELKKIIHIRYRDQNPDGLIEDLVKTAKELDVSASPGSKMALYKGVLKLKRGDRTVIDRLIDRHKKSSERIMK
jgi:hypothetical protein